VGPTNNGPAQAFTVDNPDFNIRSLRGTAVLRWEYRPGSTLFVVWTQGREDDTNRNPEQSWARDYRDLFGLHPDNTFLIKLAYWLNR
jgi:hypothetical protein